PTTNQALCAKTSRARHKSLLAARMRPRAGEIRGRRVRKSLVLSWDLRLHEPADRPENRRAGPALQSGPTPLFHCDSRRIAFNDCMHRELSTADEAFQPPRT